jgi:carboxyl-terminal processing protease
MSKRAVALASAGVLLIAAALMARAPHEPPQVQATSALPALDAASAEAMAAIEEEDGLTFRVPTGHPAALSCDDSRRIARQVRAELLAWEPEKVAPSALASGLIDWLDPYGLFAAGAGCPATAVIESRSAAMLLELETPERADCPAALAVGMAAASWMREIAGAMEEARRKPVSPGDRPWAESWTDLADSNTDARALAAEVGERLGRIERALGAGAAPYVSAAVARYAPAMTPAEWSEVVLAAALRAYVPLVDPHGAWAPEGEESSVYDLDLEATPPERAWTKATRSVIGVRIDEGGRAPLAAGDVVLEIDGVTTAGLPPEQVDQLALHAAAGEMSVVYIEAVSRKIVRAELASSETPAAAPSGVAPATLAVTRVAYGDASDVALIAIADVPDDLGRRFTTALDWALRGPRPVAGVILDLRGNGGGSTEGAIDVLGALIPGAPLFPMKRRDGTIEVERAPAAAVGPRYRGPMATLVDPGTASAAEMIAGALGAYHRAAIVGAPTYGKGCAQEYADDAAHAGVLRLTTLLYALPDGSAVQRVGLAPWSRVAFVAADVEALDREALLPHAPPSWAGPEVRDAQIVKRSEIAWPPASGPIGPCADPRVCEAIASLAAAKGPRDTLRGASARGR